MQVPPERAFLYAAALLAVALVAFVALLGATVIIWSSSISRIHELTLTEVRHGQHAQHLGRFYV